MNKVIWQVSVFFAVLIISEYLVFTYSPDWLIGFYSFAFLLVLCARSFGWPKADWLYADHAAVVQREWGSHELQHARKATDHVQTLRTHLHVRNYFAATICHQNTEQLCNEIISQLPVKIGGYGIAGILFLVLYRKGVQVGGTEDFEVLAKLIAAVSISIMPLIWEYAQCEKQKYWNRELRRPEP